MDDDRDDSFLVFGSVLTKGCDASDIDMIVPEFADDRVYNTAISLEPYEQIALETGKPVDLFFTVTESDFNVAAIYEPDPGKWMFRMAFCGRDFFTHAKGVTRRELLQLMKGEAS